MERMVRAGAHIAFIEQRISERIDPVDPPLNWERSLRLGRPRQRRILTVYRSVFGILPLLALVASTLGLVGVARHDSCYIFTLTAVFDVFLLMVLTRTFITSEYCLGVIGGRQWNNETMPQIVKLMRFDKELLELCASADDKVVPLGDLP